MDILQMSLSASILILIVLLLRAVFLNKLPKRTFLILWGIVFIQLTIPITLNPENIPTLPGITYNVSTTDEILKDIQSRAADFDSIQENTTPTIPQVKNPPELKNEIITTNTPKLTISLKDILLIGWVIGFCGTALYFAVSHLRWLYIRRTAIPAQTDAVAEWLNTHTLRRTLSVKQSDRVLSPMTYGVLSPVILLPKSAAEKSTDELYLLLNHEYSHIRSFDIAAKYLLAFALCLHWFNPLVWVMYILSNRDIEFACDEAVLQGYDISVRKKYALLILRFEEKRSRFGFSFSHSGFGGNISKERIKSIMKSKKASIAAIVSSVVLVAAVALIFTQTAPKKQLPDTSSTNFVDTISNAKPTVDKVPGSVPPPLNTGVPDPVLEPEPEPSIEPPIKVKPISMITKKTSLYLVTESQEEVYSIADGTVIFSGHKGTYGNSVCIKHENGYISFYGHLGASNEKSIIKLGAKVKRGDFLGFTSDSGNVTAEQNVVSFAISKDDTEFQWKNAISAQTIKKLIKQSDTYQRENSYDDALDIESAAKAYPIIGDIHASIAKHDTLAIEPVYSDTTAEVEALAISDGVVIAVGLGGAQGVRILIKQKDGYITEYAHLGTAYPSENQQIKAGEAIGKVGSTGRAYNKVLAITMVKGDEFDRSKAIDCFAVENYLLPASQ